jgi:hypothetical protein
VTLDLPEPAAQENQDPAPPPRVARAPWKRRFRFDNPDNPDNTNNTNNTDNTDNSENP